MTQDFPNDPFTPLLRVLEEMDREMQRAAAGYPSQPNVIPHASYTGDSRCFCEKTSEGCDNTDPEDCKLYNPRGHA